MLCSASHFEHLDDERNHQVFLPWIAGGNQQGDGCQCTAGHKGRSLLVVQQLVAREEGNKECCSAALVPIGQRMVFNHEIQQVRGFLLHRRVDVLPAISLVHSSDDSFEGVASLTPCQRIVGELG